MLPGENAIGNITAPADNTRRPTAHDFGLTECRMAEAEQVADFVSGDRLEIEAARLARRRDRPWERGVEEDVGLEQRAAGDVDGVAGRPERAIEFRPIGEREERDAVVVGRRAIAHAGVGETDRRRRHRFPGAERAHDRVTELARRHPAAAARADEIGHRPTVGPLEHDRLPGDRVAELQVRRRRDGRQHGKQRDEWRTRRARRVIARPPCPRAIGLRLRGPRCAAERA